MDYRVDTHWPQHPKRKKVQRRLGRSAVLAISDLWGFAAANRPDGDLSGMSNEDIAIAAGEYDGDPDAWVEALLDVKLLDGKPGRLRIHNQSKRQPWVSSEPDRVASARVASMTRWHRAGKHAVPKQGCPECDSSAAASSRTAPASKATPVGLRSDESAMPQTNSNSVANSISVTNPNTPLQSSWKLGEPISSPTQLQDVAGGLGLAVDVSNDERKKLTAILVGGAIEPHEVDYAVAAVRTRSERPGAPVAFFLGVVAKERRKAADEAPGEAPPPTPRQKTSEEIEDEIVAEAQRQIDARAKERGFGS